MNEYLYNVLLKRLLVSVTSPIFVEVRRFTLNSCNCYRSYIIYSYLL